jgi:Uma2 family endonuclease
MRYNVGKPEGVMPTILEPTPTLTELAARFGAIPADRIRLDRFPASEADVLELLDRTDRLYELVDGVLLEKAMGYREGYIAMRIGFLLTAFVDPRRLGVVNGADGMMRLAPGLVRIPDVSFISWRQFPGGTVPATPIPDLHPDLAVEVLSQSNAPQEMNAKLIDYFRSGTRLVWFVSVDARTVTVFRSPDRSAAVALTEVDHLDGEDVLPGFSVAFREIFANLAAE